MKSNLVVKTAGVIGVAAIGSTGTVLTYKAIRDFYSIEKLAIESSWSVSDPEELEAPLKLLKVEVSSEVHHQDQPYKYGIKDGRWECHMTFSPLGENEKDTKTKQLKDALGKYIEGYNDSTKTPRTLTISPENRWGFVKSCSRNRKEKQNHTEVNAELKISMENLSTNLEEVFKGSWRNK